MKRFLNRTHVLLIAQMLALSLVIFSTMGASTCDHSNGNNSNQPTCDFVCRVAKAAPLAVSDIEQQLPNLDSTTKFLVEDGSKAFQALFADPTLSNYQKAISIWNNEKPRLLAFNNTIVNISVAALDVLINQIEVPASVVRSGRSRARVKLNFKEADVKRLEELVRR